MTIQTGLVSAERLAEIQRTYSADRLMLHREARGLFRWDDRFWICKGHDACTYARCEQVVRVVDYEQDGMLQFLVAANSDNLFSHVGRRTTVCGESGEFIFTGVQVTFKVSPDHEGPE